MTKNKKESSFKNFKRGFFKTLKTKKETFITCYLPFIKSLSPQLLIIFGSCLYVCLGLFSAAVLGVLSLNHSNLPWFIYCYTFVYFAGLAGLLFAEFLTKKNRHFNTYILLTTLVNIAFALFFYSQQFFNFFDRLFPQALLLTICAFIFYLSDYNVLHSKKRKKNKKV